MLQKYFQIFIKIKEMYNIQCFKPSKTYDKKQLNENQISEAKETQILNDRLLNSPHTFLFCRDKEQILTVSEAKIVQNERRKYLEHLKKNYKYKIPSEFLSKRAMKEKSRQLKKTKIQKQAIKQIEKVRQKEKKQVKKISKSTKIAKPETKSVKNKKEVKGKVKESKKEKDQKEKEKQIDKIKIDEQKEEQQMKQMSQQMEMQMESEMDLQNKSLSELDYQ